MYPPHELDLRVEEVFQEVDFNNDGTINFSEFYAATMKKEKMLSREALRKAFLLFDLDGNGYITQNELEETIPINTTEKLSWAEIIKEVDIDGDGQVILFFNYRFRLKNSCK